MSKKCPLCQVSMLEIKIPSHYDSSFSVEQCESCGGLWLDNLEIYYAKIGASGLIPEINREKLIAKSILKDEKLICPNDGSALIQFKDNNFPASLHLDSCPRCSGFWLNRAEFVEFQDQRSKIMEEYKKPDSEEDKIFKEHLNKLIQSDSSTGNFDSVANFSHFLMTPINPANNRALAGTDLNIARDVNNTAEMAFGILNLIFRLFLR